MPYHPQREYLEEILRPYRECFSQKSKGEKLQAVGIKLSKFYSSLSQQIENVTQKIERNLRTVIDTSKIQILVESHQLKRASKGQIIPAKAIYSYPLKSRKEAKCYISCGHWES